MVARLELAIENSVVHAFKDVKLPRASGKEVVVINGESITLPYDLRDSRYGLSSAHNNPEYKLPAIILTGFYVQLGCNLENLASELYLVDMRNRDSGRYPDLYNATIAGLYHEFLRLSSSEDPEDEEANRFKARKMMVEEELNRRLEKI